MSSMIKIQMKPVTYFALRLDDNFDINEFAREFENASYHWKKAEHMLIIFGPTDTVAQSGDWIVRAKDGTVQVYSMEKFVELFEVVP